MKNICDKEKKGAAMNEINEYITKRYDRWLDYAEYHCSHAGIPDEANDVLNEVLCSLLTKDPTFIIRLLHSKKNGYTELDFFVLRMIKLNACSPTSPYQSRYKVIPTDENVDYSRIELPDEDEEQFDRAGDILDKVHLVRNILDSINLSPLARRVFQYRFFEGGDFKEWPGKEDMRDLYEIYNKVQSFIRQKIQGESIF